jgi:hypothetical protein
MNVTFGIAYLALGLATTATLVGRLYTYWGSFQNARKALLLGYMVIMFGFTQRGIELLWFNAPGPRPAAYLSVLGACVCLTAFLMSEDTRLRPVRWQDALKHQEPNNYDKYIEILNYSAVNRNAQTTHSSQYKPDDYK